MTNIRSRYPPVPCPDRPGGPWSVPITVPDSAMSGPRRGDWGAGDPLVGVGIVGMVQVRVGVEAVHPSSDEVDDAVHRNDPGVVATQRHRLAAAVAILCRIVDKMPV